MEVKLNGSQTGQSAYRQEALETQANQTLSRLETVKATFSQPSWIIATTTLFDIAEVCGIEVTSVSSSVPTKGVLEGIPCSVQTLTVGVTGETLNLASFITQLNHKLETGVVKSIVMNVPETNDETKPSAEVGLIFYTYQGE